MGCTITFAHWEPTSLPQPHKYHRPKSKTQTQDKVTITEVPVHASRAFKRTSQEIEQKKRDEYAARVQDSASAVKGIQFLAAVAGTACLAGGFTAATTDADPELVAHYVKMAAIFAVGLAGACATLYCRANCKRDAAPQQVFPKQANSLGR